MKRLFCFYPLFILSIGCASVNIGLVEPKANVYLSEKYSSDTLFVFIDNRIENNFTSKSSGGIKDVIITEYRKSLTTAFTHTFNPFFKEVKFVDQTTNKGILLHLKYAYPRVYKFKSHYQRGSDKFGDYENPMPEVKFKMDYVASLHKNGNKIKQVEKELVSEGNITTIFEMDNLLRDVIEVMCRDMSKNIF